MTIRLTGLVGILALAATAAPAQVRPQPGLGDPRLQTLSYDPGQIVQLQGAPGYQLTVELSPDEQVQNVAVGDSGAWQVSVNKAGDHLFIRPSQAGVSTNMTVITNIRVYNFDLIPLAQPTPDMAYTVKFKYPAAPAGAPSEMEKRAAVPRIPGRYRIEGDRGLRPSKVTEDGFRTYITWPADLPIPATFQIGDNDEERLVNGSMRGDRFVVDGVARKLIFRIDQKVASAVWLAPRKSR